MERYVLITGASGGIGRAVAILLSKEYPLILCGRNETKLKETRSLCQNNGTHILWKIDLSNLMAIGGSLSTFMEDQNASIGAFVHSAGVGMGIVSPIRMMSHEFIASVMNVNFLSAVEIMKVLVSRKINGKSLSSVVFISSISSCLGSKGISMYGASKGALDAFARSAAYELAPNIRVNTIAPGDVVKTENLNWSSEQFDDDLVRQYKEQGYLLGVGTVWDVANMCAFLISDKSRWMTGQTFLVDGGKQAHF